MSNQKWEYLVAPLEDAGTLMKKSDGLSPTSLTGLAPRVGKRSVYRSSGATWSRGRWSS